CLREQWLHDSLKAGYALPHDGYEVVEEASSTTSIDSKPSRIESAPTKRPANHQAATFDHKSLADQIDNMVASFRHQDFLEECTLYAVGFDPVALESIKNAARRCGALFVSDFKPRSVSHVIIGPSVKPSDLRTL